MGFRRRQIGHAVTNVTCFLAVMVLAVVLVVRPLSPWHLGFFCDDVTIRYPYNEDTVSVTVLVLSCFLPALGLVAGVELAYGLLLTSTSATSYVADAPKDSPTDRPPDTTKAASMKAALSRTGLLVACLIHGNALCFVLTEVFKLSFGRLRPYFLSACQPEPDVTSFSNCSAGIYIEDITCLNPDSDKVVDLRKSFISGHASFAVFNMLFICLYLQLRLPAATPRLVFSVLQGVALGYAIFVCGSRIYDHAHHPQDVLGGACFAVLCVAVTIFKICPDFVWHARPRQDPNSLPKDQGTSLVSVTSVRNKE